MNVTQEGVSGYTISTSFRELMDDQRTPGFWGVKVGLLIQSKPCEKDM